jgi:hypothetical protein
MGGKLESRSFLYARPGILLFVGVAAVAIMGGDLDGSDAVEQERIFFLQEFQTEIDFRVVLSNERCEETTESPYLQRVALARDVVAQLANKF